MRPEARPLTGEPQRIRLRDGRRLAFEQRGDLSGKPVFYFHGTPGSRLAQPDAEISRSLGARVVSLDRPGFGCSDFQPGRTLLDWPGDVLQAADALGIDRFAVVGNSGGAPYVAACAYAIPERLTRVALVAGGAPADAPDVRRGMSRDRRLGYRVARHTPWLLRVAVWAFGNPQRDPEKFFERYNGALPPSDQALLARPEARREKIAAYAEATRAGLRGFAHEIALFARPWGFPLEGIRIPVLLWHGEEDTSTPVSMARYVESAIPDCRAVYFPGEGHMLLLSRWEEIVAELVA